MKPWKQPNLKRNLRHADGVFSRRRNSLTVPHPNSLRSSSAYLPHRYPCGASLSVCVPVRPSSLSNCRPLRTPFPTISLSRQPAPRCLFACKLRLTLLLAPAFRPLAGATIRLGLALLFGNEGGYTAVERVGLLLLGRKDVTSEPIRSS